MGFKLVRVRYHEENQLAVEICNGTKHICPDVLTTRYKDLGESKYLVSPVDAVNLAIKLVSKWHNDYWDELKKIAVVNADGKGGKTYYDPTNKRDLVRLEKWGQDTLASMGKCAHCKKPMGARDPFEIDEIPNKQFCNEACLANTYRHMFGVEPPRVSSKGKKNNLKGKP